MGVNQIVEKAEGYGWHKNDSYLAVSIQLEASRNITKVPEALAEIHIRVFKRIVSTKYGSKTDCREG